MLIIQSVFIKFIKTPIELLRLHYFPAHSVLPASRRTWSMRKLMFSESNIFDGSLSHAFATFSYFGRWRIDDLLRHLCMDQTDGNHSLSQITVYLKPTQGCPKRSLIRHRQKYENVVHA